ncbi:ATP-binding protein [Streptomyces sp. NPDC088789]|uniref:ATP-binding protein n=1 Tax=Streptomyces sp. NPDC088789 TaxID=3365899 RepID=UPI00381F78B3
MVSVQPPPGHRELPLTRLLLPPAVVMAAVTAAAVVLVAQPARVAVGVCGAMATLLVLLTSAEIVRRGRTVRDLKAEHARHCAYLEHRIADNDRQMLYLATDIVPGAIDHLRKGNSMREVMNQLDEIEQGWGALPEPQRELVRLMLRIVDHEENLRDSAHRSFVNVARRVQAIVHQQANELREMEEDHGHNPEVFDDLLRLDHGTALIGRLADSISVLGGGRPSRQWPEAVSMYSTLRGAMSRILEYRRISLDNIARISAKGIYVEPIIHACAELFDNATRYSPPHTKVHVTAVEVQSGLAIEIEDGGMGLGEETRASAELMLANAMLGIDIQDIGGSPRLGLAVVGRLCKQFNMQISMRTSAYGGVRAVLVVPMNMLTHERGVGLAHGIGATGVPVTMDALQGPARPPKTRRPTNPKIPVGVSLEDDVPEVTEWTAGGLPQRRSRATIPITQRITEQYAAQYAAERAEKAEREAREAARAARPHPEPEPEQPEQKPFVAPGAWVESFWEGLKKDLPPGTHPTEFTRNPTKFLHLIDDTARTEADDEGDAK